MRSLGAIALLAACGSSSKPTTTTTTAPTPDVAAETGAHDVILARSGSYEAPVLEMIDVATGALTQLHEAGPDEYLHARWAGPHVVLAREGDDGGLVEGLDPVTGMRWIIDGGNAGQTLVVSADGRHVAWDCVAKDGGSSICAAPVDGSGPIVELIVSTDESEPTPIGWTDSLVLYADEARVYAVSSRGGGQPNLIAQHASQLHAFRVAPDGSSFLHFSDEGFAIIGVDGTPRGTVVFEEGAYDGACEYAGSEHLVCKREGELQLLDLTGAATTLITADVDQVIGAPSGDGAAYTDGDGVLYVIRGGSPPRSLGEANVMWFLDWRP